MSPLRVGVDASAAAVPQPTGVGLAIAGQVAALRRRPEIALDILYRLSRLKRRSAFLPGPSGVFHERWSLLLARRLDVFHGPDTRLPRFAGPALVTTIHDLSARRPGFASPGFRATRERHWADAAARASLLVTYTAAIASEVSRELSIPRERIAVVPLAPAGDAARPAPAAVEEARARHAGGDPYVLCLGELSARKNTATAVRAFAAASARGHRLLLVGPMGHGADEVEAAVREAGLGERVARAGYLPAAEVAALLAGAAAFLFPTRYEGFGLPVLEAFAAGAPVVTSHDPAVLEVAGGAARHAPADDPRALGDALAAVLEDQAEATRLRAAGRARASAFTWERTAVRLLAVYEAARAGQPAPQWRAEEEAPCSR
ncbi:MAG: glycosyltransferase family 4 protein [Planctomycetota bacterium]